MYKYKHSILTQCFKEVVMNHMHEINKINFTPEKLRIILPGKVEPIHLTQREAMIVALMMIGQRAKQIAWKLKISLHTVNSHMANIKQKLDCNTNFEVGYILGWFKFYQEQLSKS